MSHSQQRFHYLYPLGYMGFGFMDTLFSQWIVYYHAPPGQSQNTLIGTVLLVSFVLQGLFNPLLGVVADRLRHPWGRRRPFILFCSFPLAMIFMAMWWTRSFIPSLLLLLIYGLCFVCVVQPYMALLPVLAPTQSMRVRFNLVGGILNLIASGAALIGGPLLLKYYGFPIFGLLAGGLLIITVFIPTLLFQEPAFEAQLSPLSAPSILAPFRAVLANRSFVAFLWGNALMILLILSLTIVLPYLTQALLRQSEAYTSVVNGFTLIGVLCGIAYTVWQGEQIQFLPLLSKNLGLNGFLLILTAGLSFVFPLPLWVWWLLFISIGFMVFLGLMAPNVLLAEFVDQDGKQREGAIFGLNGLGINLAKALASQMVALCLLWGMTEQEPMGVQGVLLFSGGVALVAASCFAWAARLNLQQSD